MSTFQRGTGQKQGWLPTGEARSAEALRFFASLPLDRREISAQCDYTGRQKVRIAFGTTDALAYAFLDDTQAGAYYASAPMVQRRELFQSLLSWLIIREGFVNSDPRSPEYFHCEPSVEDLIRLTGELFRVKVEYDF
jgi:hypothetical protein